MRIGVGLSIPELATRGGRFSPASLFTSGVAGAWYDPSDYSTLFQDSAGTTPVTAVEQPVGLMLDKSQGATLGSELVTNGDFASGSTGWTLGTGWSISGGAAIATAVPGGSTIESVGQCVSGQWYRATVTVPSHTAGGFSFAVSGVAVGQVYSAAGTYTQYFVAPATGYIQLIRRVSDFTGSIDNISVKAITGNHASQATAASRPVLRARYNLLTYSNQADNAAWTKSNSFVQTNLLTYSEDFTNAAWATTDLTVTANAAIAPNGTLTADLFTEGSGGTAKISQSITGASANATFCASINLARGNNDWYRILIYDTVTDTNRISAWVNLGTGAVGSATNGGTATGATVSMVSVGNGYYRIIVTGAVNNSVSALTYYVASANANLSATRVSGATVYAWGSQLVQGSVPGDYRATTSAALPCLYADYNGALRARKLCENTTATIGHRVQQNLGTLTGSAFTFSEYLKAGERTWAYLRYDDLTTTNFVWFNLATGAVGSTSMSGATIISGSISNAGNGYYRCTATVTNSGFTSTVFGVGPATGDANQTYTGDGSSGIYIADAQLWQGSVPGNYQNINAATDYATAGFLPYLALDGTDDSFGTNSIDFTATDKMSVCAGVTKLSDAVQVIAELSANSDATAGTFYLANVATSTLRHQVAGSPGGAARALGETTLTNPSTAVVTQQFNIAGASVATQIVVRQNGVAQTLASTAGTAGTGNFSSNPLFIGRRNNTSFPFNGRIYQLIVCGKTLSASELASTEAYVNSKTGAY